MRFGIYTEMQCPPEKPHAQLYWEIQRQIEHADEMGFDVYSTIDHHFSQEFGISANPLALFCAAARRARRIRFRTALHVLPPKNPGEFLWQSMRWSEGSRVMAVSSGSKRITASRILQGRKLQHGNTTTGLALRLGSPVVG
jgi:Luciferase-like monooxygenase